MGLAGDLRDGDRVSGDARAVSASQPPPAVARYRAALRRPGDFAARPRRRDPRAAPARSPRRAGDGAAQPGLLARLRRGLHHPDRRRLRHLSSHLAPAARRAGAADAQADRQRTGHRLCRRRLSLQLGAPSRHRRQEWPAHAQGRRNPLGGGEQPHHDARRRAGAPLSRPARAPHPCLDRRRRGRAGPRPAAGRAAVRPPAVQPAAGPAALGARRASRPRARDDRAHRLAVASGAARGRAQMVGGVRRAQAGAVAPAQCVEQGRAARRARRVAARPPCGRRHAADDDRDDHRRDAHRRQPRAVGLRISRRRRRAAARHGAARARPARRPATSAAPRGRRALRGAAQAGPSPGPAPARNRVPC